MKPEELQAIQESDQEEILARFHEMWVRLGERNARFSEEEVADDVTEALNECPQS